MSSTGASFVAYVVYGTLSFLSVAFVGLKPIFSHGLLNELLDVCPGGPNALRYTGVDALDQVLCFLISIQHAVLEEDLKPLMRYGLTVIPVIFVFLHVESGRRTGVLSHPVLFSMAWQVMSWALILSIYSLLFVTTPHASTAISEKKASSVAIAFAISATFVVYEIFLEHPRMTAVWQISPAVVWFAQKASFRWLLPRDGGVNTGHGTVIAVYFSAFLVAAPYHIYVALSQWGQLYSLFMPILDAQDGTLPHIVHELLKWDMPIGSFAVLIATLWFARTKLELFYLLVNVIVGSVAVGPGGALAIVMIWREKELARKRSSKDM